MFIRRANGYEYFSHRCSFTRGGLLFTDVENPAAPLPPFHRSFPLSMSLLDRAAWRRGMIVSALVVLALGAGATDVSSSYRGREWLKHDYLEPNPDRFVASIFELSRTRYFTLPGHAMLGTGFMASLFRQNPAQIETWLIYCRRLPEAECRMVVAALRDTGYPKGEEYLKLHADITPIREYVRCGVKFWWKSRFWKHCRLLPGRRFT
jgi:hypothetical protein